MFNLRYYQHEAQTAVWDAFQGHQSAAVVQATGTGKTELYLSIAVQERLRVLVVVHRDYLITSPVKRLAKVGFDDVAVEKADQRAERGGRRAKIVFASVQSIGPESQRSRLETFDPAEFSLVIVDEGHRATSVTYRRVMDYFKTNRKLKVLILTATPKRRDGVALGNIAETIAYTMTPEVAAREGWIVRPRFFRRDVDGLDFSKVVMKGADLDEEQVSALLMEEKPLHQVCASLSEDVGPTIVFCPQVIVAQTYAALLNKRYRPGRAMAIHEGSDGVERERATTGLADGSTDWLFNVDMYTEGYDLPKVTRVVWAAPTASLVKWTQGCGRGFRPDGSIAHLLTGEREDSPTRRELIAGSAKPVCDIVTYYPSNCRHQICSAVDLLGGDELPADVKEMAEDIQKETGGGGDGSDTESDIDTAKKLVDLRKLLDEKRKRIKATAQVRDSEYDGMGSGSTRKLKDGERGQEATAATKAVSTDWPAGDTASEKQRGWFRFKGIACPATATKFQASVVRDLIELGMPATTAWGMGRAQALTVRDSMRARAGERKAVPA